MKRLREHGALTPTPRTSRQHWTQVSGALTPELVLQSQRQSFCGKRKGRVVSLDGQGFPSSRETNLGRLGRPSAAERLLFFFREIRDGKRCYNFVANERGWVTRQGTKVLWLGSDGNARARYENCNVAYTLVNGFDAVGRLCLGTWGGGAG